MVIARNTKGLLDYKLADTLEAGLILVGEEIKAIRARRVNINGSHIRPFANKSGKIELWWLGGNFQTPTGDKTRSRKLLLHQNEIKRLRGKLSAGEATILPIELYLNRGLAKLKIGLASRKNKADRREELRRRDLDRDTQRELATRSKKSS